MRSTSMQKKIKLCLSTNMDLDLSSLGQNGYEEVFRVALATLVVLIFYCFGLKKCKCELAYFYLKYLAKRPEKRFMTSRAVTSVHHRRTEDQLAVKPRQMVEYRSSALIQPSSEISLVMAEDENSQKVKFEEVVVQLFKRRVYSLPESDLIAPTRGIFEDSMHEKRMSKFIRRLTFPPDSREHSSHKLDLKESLTKKLNEHKELINSRIEEFSPVFFFRTPNEEGNMWLEHPRHFHLENTRKADLMNFFAFDGKGNFLVIWALRRASCTSGEIAPSASDFKDFKSTTGTIKTVSETRTLDPEYQCVAEFFIVIHLAGVGSFQLPKGSGCRACSCTTRPTRVRNQKVNLQEPFFDAGGLRLECVEYMNKWKVTFKGLLSKDGQEDQNNCEVKTQFAFWWNAISRPFHFQHELSTRCLAEDISKERWSSGFFQKLSNWRLRREINYSQWGGMKGKLKVDEFNKVVVFRGPRVHFYGPLESALNKPSTLWMIYSEQGHMIHLESTAVGDTLKELKTGYICHPNGVSKAITSLSMDNRVPAKRLSIPKNWKFQFEAGSDIHYYVTCDVEHRVQLVTPNNMMLQVATINMSNTKGYALSCITYKEDALETAFPTKRCDQPSFREFNPLNKDFETWTIPLGNPACVNSSLVGVKGCRMAYIYQISSKNYMVADGICLTTNALEYHLFHHPSIRNAISLLKQKSGINSPDLVGQCMEVVKLLQDTPMLTEMVWNVEDALSKQFGLEFPNRYFAIRVSSKTNDGFRILGSSMKPILDVRGFDKILKMILYCWSAPFFYDSVSYRRENGLKIDVYVSIIIQLMVHPKTCGTICSNDPSPRYQGRITIEAKVGMDKTEGPLDVDFVLSRDCRNKVSLYKRTFSGHKLSEASNVASRSWKGAKATISRELNLSESVLIELALCAVEMEQHFGSPQSVEFAIDENDNKYVFKAMPIVRSPSTDEWMIMHEFDSSLSTDYEIVFKDITIGPSTPLTLSLLVPAINDAYTNLIKSVLIFGSTLSNDRCICCYQNQIMVNAYESMLLAAASDFSGHKSIVEMCITGKVLSINYDDYHPRFPFYKRLINAIALLQAAISSTRRGDELQYLAEKLNICPQGPLTSKRLYESITRNIPSYMRGHFLYLTCYSSPNVWMYGLMLYICEKEEWSANHSYLVSMLLSKYGTENISSRFEELKAEIIKSEAAKKLIKSEPQDFYSWLNSPNSGPCGVLFQKFMNDYGHRCPNEMEFMDKSWQKDPLRLVKALQSMVDKSDQPSKSASKTPVIMSIGFFKKMVINFLLKKIFQGLEYREQTKNSLVAIHSKFKEAYWLLAEKMVHEGRLPEPDLMFYLTHPEIGKLLLTRSPHFMTLAWSRKAGMENLISTLPFVSVAFREAEVRRSFSSQGKLIVRGTPISPGDVTGPVRVVIRTSDFDKVERGEILVATMFEEPWAYCLSFILGIVIESGGLLSSGASFARQYALPCVIDAEHATSILQTGDLVQLNGHDGTVRKLADEEEGAGTTYPSQSQSPQEQI